MHNMVCVIGRICQDVEIERDGDKEVANITMAVQREYKNEDGIYETDFVDVVLCGALASHTAEYCRKGDLVGVKGRIQNRIVNDIQKTYVVADKISFLASAKGAGNE